MKLTLKFFSNQFNVAIQKKHSFLYSRAENGFGQARPCPARPGPARPGPARKKHLYFQARKGPKN